MAKALRVHSMGSGTPCCCFASVCGGRKITWYYFLCGGVVITDLRYRESGKSEKEGGEARGFGRLPERVSRDLSVEMMLRLALSSRDEARMREA